MTVSLGEELAEANGDLRAGYFGPSWEYTEDDTEWMRTRHRILGMAGGAPLKS